MLMGVNLDFVRYLDREGKLYCHFLALVPIADGKADTIVAAVIYIYIYAFSRRFYPKRLTLHSSYSFTFHQFLLSLGIEPMIFALLAPCSTI